MPIYFQVAGFESSIFGIRFAKSFPGVFYAPDERGDLAFRFFAEAALPLRGGQFPPQRRLNRQIRLPARDYSAAGKVPSLPQAVAQGYFSTESRASHEQVIGHAVSFP